MPVAERERWREARSKFPNNTALQRTLDEAYADLVRELAGNGVPLLAGSDAGFPFIFHGRSLHDELALLVRAGLTPLQALQAATVSPVRYLGLADSLGTVAEKKKARRPASFGC